MTRNPLLQALKMHTMKCKPLTIVFILLITLVSVSCSNFYRVAERKHVNLARELDSLRVQNRYFILRAGTEAYHLENVVVDQDGQTIRYSIDTLPQWHSLHLKNGYGGKKRYRKHDPTDLHVLNEVHLYTDNQAFTPGQSYLLPISSVRNVEVLIHDKKRSTRSKLITATFVAVGLTLAFAVMVGMSFKSLVIPIR